MQNTDIQKFLDNKTTTGHECVRITFKKRNTLNGIFVRDHRDYGEMMAKNFWRIVPESQIEAWEATGNVQLAKLFLGSEFTRLSIRKED